MAGNANSSSSSNTTSSDKTADRHAQQPPQIATFIDYARYTFARTSVPPAVGVRDAERGGAVGGAREEEGYGHGYGYGCMRGGGGGCKGWKGVKLGLKDVGEVVRDVAKELGERGKHSFHLESKGENSSCFEVLWLVGWLLGWLLGWLRGRVGWLGFEYVVCCGRRQTHKPACRWTRQSCGWAAGSLVRIDSPFFVRSFVVFYSALEDG